MGGRGSSGLIGAAKGPNIKYKADLLNEMDNTDNEFWVRSIFNGTSVTKDYFMKNATDREKATLHDMINETRRQAREENIVNRNEYNNTVKAFINRVGERQYGQIKPGDTFSKLKPGAKIEYWTTVRRGGKSEKLTGTLHKIEGRQIGVSKAGGEYRVTDLRSGLSLGKHTSQTEALKIAADGIKKIGKTTLDQRTKQILANKNKTWIRGK